MASWGHHIFSGKTYAKDLAQIEDCFPLFDVSRNRCQSGHRADWGLYIIDAAFDPAPEADGGRCASTRCRPAARSRS